MRVVSLQRGGKQREKGGLAASTPADGQKRVWMHERHAQPRGLSSKQQSVFPARKQGDARTNQRGADRGQRTEALAAATLHLAPLFLETSV
jgi:hypothetical protein